MSGDLGKTHYYGDDCDPPHVEPLFHCQYHWWGYVWQLTSPSFTQGQR